MSTFTLDHITKAWLKQASTMPDPSQTDDDALEQAFMDQAYTAVSNRCGPLMKAPYAIGFEIVKKNEDNTKLAGIFAFRIGKGLVYVPVFFINSTVKGADLLYRHSVKRFTPNNEAWVKKLISSESESEGKPFDKADLYKYPPNIDLESIAYPPDGFLSQQAGKYAAEHEEALQKFASEKGEVARVLDEYLNAAFEPGEKLAAFLKEAGVEAFEKFASWVAADDEFAAAANLLLPLESFMSEDFINSFEKKACDAEPVYDLVLHEELTEKSASLSAPDLDLFFKQGFFIEDVRGGEDITPVYQDMERQVETIHSPGVYSVLTSHGKYREAFFAFEGNSARDINSMESHYLQDCYPVRSSCGGGRTCKDKRGIFLDDNTVFTDRGNSRAVGTCSKSLEEVIAEGKLLKEKPTAGKGWALFDDENGSLSRPFYVTNVKSENGVTVVTFHTYGFSHSDHGDKLIVNPDIKGSGDRGVYGYNVRFIEVACETSKSDGYTNLKWTQSSKVVAFNALDEWIYDSGELTFRKITAETGNGGFLFSSGRFHNTGTLTDKEASVFLSRDLGVVYKEVPNILKAASESTTPITLWLEMSADVEKKAAMLRIVDRMDFDRPNMRNVWGVNEEHSRSKALRVAKGFIPLQRNSRLGDARDPGRGWGGNKDSGKTEAEGLPKEVLLSASPGKIAELTKTHQLPHTFEHGVIGSLLATYDSSSQIETYMSDLEVALDKIGRILFLFYWKPSDYEALYGSDDMSNLESELLSNFKSFGDMVINLMKRNKNSQVAVSGNNSMAL